MHKSPKSKEQASARETLRNLLPPGAVVWCILRHVSRSGMQREISLVKIGDEGVFHLDGLVSSALGWRIGKHDGIVVGGCGMDMGFHLVSTLSRYLYRGGFGCIGERCPSNDHSNGDRDFTPHYDGTPRDSSEVGKDLKPYQHCHHSGDYALRHQWL